MNTLNLEKKVALYREILAHLMHTELRGNEDLSYVSAVLHLIAFDLEPSPSQENKKQANKYFEYIKHYIETQYGPSQNTTTNPSQNLSVTTSPLGSTEACT